MQKHVGGVTACASVRPGRKSPLYGDGEDFFFESHLSGKVASPWVIQRAGFPGCPSCSIG
ncbi:hypothetical protein CDL15_Pgr015796 [Punica granatum]|uniref:Uncharacterized protein n=1 Tax=Punica granatum TaxID=22663 RepID=A0A218XPJ2_PUNGR|nr:hypothetical protein CDL15_Pgr015796 [Punica granatum]